MIWIRSDWEKRFFVVDRSFPRRGCTELSQRVLVCGQEAGAQLDGLVVGCYRWSMGTPGGQVL